MFEVENIDSYCVIELMDEESKIETTLFIEGDKNKLISDDLIITATNLKVIYEKDSLCIDLTRGHKKSYKSQSDSIAARIYSNLAAIKDVSHSVNVYAVDDLIHVERFMKGSLRIVQKFIFHPNDLLEVSYSNLSHGKVFFIFKFLGNCAIFINRERFELIKGENKIGKFSEFRFLDNPLRKII